MKPQTFLSRLYLSIFWLLTSLPVLAQGYVTLHEECDFRGKSYILEAGTYRLYQMKIGNDKLSSIQVPAGFRVTLYEDDYFRGRTQTFSSNVNCLDSAWNDNASSIVVEHTTIQQTNPNEYVVFYNDCYNRGFSRSLRPGIYKGADLGELKNNISSFSIFGNLRVRAYTSSEEASGYFTNFDITQNCLDRNFNDRISSLVIEYKPYNSQTETGSFGDGGSVLFYTDCNYKGNALRLLPGRYDGQNLGLFRNSIASLQVPAGMQIRIYKDDNFSGISTTLSGDNSCLGYDWKNRIGSIMVEDRGGFGGNSNNQPQVQNVTLYTDANYRGQSAVLLPGTYANMQLADGFPEKALSSVQIPAGYRVVLYDQPNLRGKSYTLTASRSSFSLSSWNDRAMSIAVYRN